MKLVCDNSKAAEMLNWRPKVSLEEGLKRTIQFIRENLDLYRADQYVV